jgi:hypothetical protein
VVSSLQHLRDPNDPNDLGVIVEVTGGEVVTPLNAIRPCGKEVPPRGPWT